MSLRVDYDERAISQAAAFLDDPHGIRAVLDAIDQLADDPRPAGSFPYGSPDLRRLRVGRYRVLEADGQHWSQAVFGVADENAAVLRVVADFDAVAAA